jgi:hypothetical protein
VTTAQLPEPFPALPRLLFTAAPDGGSDSGAPTSGDDLVGIVEYLTEVARVRAVPMNVPLAFNALAFGFDLRTRRYRSELVQPDRLPLFALEQTVPVLPSGALARLVTPSEPMPVEVLYREGEHEALRGDGALPAWLSGAPQGATAALRASARGPWSGDAARMEAEPVDGAVDAPDGVRVRERLVPDLNVLAEGGRARARRLDERYLTMEQHVHVVSVYDDAVQADLPEARLYAQYLVDRQPEVLSAALTATGLVPDSSDGQWTVAALQAHVQNALDSIEVLLELSSLVQWREGWLHPQLLADLDGGEHGVDRDDVRRIAVAVAREALGRDVRGGLRLPDQPSYLALGPALRREFDGSDAVRGVRYPATIAWANLTLARQLQDAGGIVTVGRPGVGDVRVHVRLDDAFQGGGVWRSECLADDADTADLAPVDLPLALGWRDAAVPAVPFQRDPFAANARTGMGTSGADGSLLTDDTSGHERSTTTDDTQADDARLPPAPAPPAAPTLPPSPPMPAEPDSRPSDTRADDTLRCWTVSLTQRAWDTGALVLSTSVTDTMHDAGLVGAPLQVQLNHPGVAADMRLQPVELEPRRLTGLTWPAPMFVGMRLNATWSLDGGGYFVSVEGVPLDEPVVVDGVPLDYAFDEEVLLRAWGVPKDLQEPDDSLTPALVLQLLRSYALRAARPVAAPTVLFLPWQALLQAARHAAHARQMHDIVALNEQDLAAEVERCVDGLRLRSTMHGSVLVEWGAGQWREAGVSSDGQYREPRTVAHRAGLELDELCVTLRLLPKPSGRPSLKAAPSGGLLSGGPASLRRGHSRVLTRGTPSAHKRAELVAWAEARGINRAWLHPQATFVSESEVRRTRRR